MSGGHFNYDQHRITGIADEIERLIKTNNSKKKDEYGDDYGNPFKADTIAKFKLAVKTLRQAAIMAQRIDWLVSGDDGEDNFHKYWDAELKKRRGHD